MIIQVRIASLKWFVKQRAAVTGVRRTGCSRLPVLGTSCLHDLNRHVHKHTDNYPAYPVLAVQI